MGAPPGGQMGALACQGAAERPLAGWSRLWRDGAGGAGYLDGPLAAVAASGTTNYDFVAQHVVNTEIRELIYQALEDVLVYSSLPYLKSTT